MGTPKLPRRSIAPKRELRLRADYEALANVLQRFGQGLRAGELVAATDLGEERVRAALKYAGDLGYLADLGELGWHDPFAAERLGYRLVQTAPHRCRYFTVQEVARRGLVTC